MRPCLLDPSVREERNTQTRKKVWKERHEKKGKKAPPCASAQRAELSVCVYLCKSEISLPSGLPLRCSSACSDISSQSYPGTFWPAS